MCKLYNRLVKWSKSRSAPNSARINLPSPRIGSIASSESDFFDDDVEHWTDDGIEDYYHLSIYLLLVERELIKMESAWTKTGTQVLKELQVEPKAGLSTQEVETRTGKYGKNGELDTEHLLYSSKSNQFHSLVLPEPPSVSLFSLILDQFKDQLVLILLGSAVISFILALLEDHDSLLGALVEPGVIFLILIANATVGVVQERNAEESIEVSLFPPMCRATSLDEI